MNKKNFVFFTLLCIAIPVIMLPANDTEPTPLQAWQIAEQRLGNAITHFTRVEAERNNIHTKWEINKEEIRDATVKSLVDGVFGGVDPIAGLKDAFGTALTVGLDMDEDIILTSLLDTAISATDTWYTEVGSKDKDRNKAYQAYLSAWYAAHPNYAQSPSGPRPENKIWTVPQKKDFSFRCYGNCSDTFTSPSSAKTGHQKSYWDRNYNKRFYGYDCPSVDNDDWQLCRGGCGTEFPPIRYPLYTTKTPQDGSHLSLCSEDHKFSFNPINYTRLIYYYKCNGQTSDECPNAHLHVDDDDDDSTASTPDPTPDPTPAAKTYHACGVHETWQSGDHSSTYCYKTNENGTCTVGSYYACASHTCDFPDPPNTAVCTRVVTKKRWDVVRRRGSRKIYGWVEYQEVCGETYNVLGTEECVGAYDGNRSYKHSSD